MKPLFFKTLYHIYIRLIGIVKPISVGVRVLLIRDEKVLMVRHIYQDEWFLVGGGVKRGETIEEAARREAMEEAGATLGHLTLFGIYTNFIHLRSDYITVFLCDDFTYTGAHDHEIDAIELFPLNALPQSLTPGIRNRLNDYIAGKKPKNGFGLW